MPFTLPKTYNVYFLAIISTVGGMLFGFDIASMSAIVVTDQYIDYFNNPAGALQGAIGSALAAGSVIGCISILWSTPLFAGPLSDKIGRRDACPFACLWWLAGTAVQVAVTSAGMLIAGRMLNGVCVGTTSSQVPVYLAEIAKKNMRQLTIEVGILLMFFIGYGCSFIPGPAAFRTAWGIQFVPCFVLICGLPFLPRSPRWLAKVGRTEEAVTILAKIQAKGDVTDPMVIAEWEEITTVLAAEREAPPGWRRFVVNGMWRRTLAGFSVQAWQQLSGANVITYYIVYVFLMANLSGNANLTSGGIQYALFIVFTLVTYLFIDKTGRRPLLIYGAHGMAVCHYVIGGMLLSYGEAVPGGVQGNANVLVRVSGSPAYTVIAFSYLLIIVYALTLAPIAWVYAAEVWSLETRAYGMSIAALGNWIFNFALGMFIPSGFRNTGGGLFLVFGTLCVLAAIQSFLLYPETARKSLEEIETMFHKSRPKPWRTHPGSSHLDVDAEEVRRKASAPQREGKPQVLHKDGTVDTADNDSTSNDKKEEV
ncbi:hypothetical protein BAUCODRAFT_122930 [Baudoinia panamericana UAMH 10762]|uniref:Major facilitator superfamily (MFS) profile domain-containing protein n=1 Tax=Baudoinia panamericana (strain UAMH 10762) TaxID=717646 RepID=M2LMR8_BAUPA|nr:uncharacterized protein BAUCODRAFT_122930 [Baudoinia panamericana UAMH 10762]EMC95622.1 hypothetical protein BAUCODRAFT_122930 [Baudoinia panamericana UAMH 10762]